MCDPEHAVFCLLSYHSTVLRPQICFVILGVRPCDWETEAEVQTSI